MKGMGGMEVMGASTPLYTTRAEVDMFVMVVT